MVVERTLYLFHLLGCSLFGILLHTGINGSVNLQTAAIEVVAIFLHPFLEVIGDVLTEILCLPVIVFLNVYIQFQRKLRVCRVFVAGQYVVRNHVV